MKNRFILFLLTGLFYTGTVTAALALDYSAGPITLSSPPIDGLPVQVTARLCNNSGATVTGPVEVKLSSSNGDVLILSGPAQQTINTTLANGAPAPTT